MTGWIACHDELLSAGGRETLAAELLAADLLVRDRRGFPTADERSADAYRALVGPVRRAGCSPLTGAFCRCAATRIRRCSWSQGLTVAA